MFETDHISMLKGLHPIFITNGILKCAAYLLVIYTNSFRILISLLTRAPSTNDVTMTAESSPPLMTRERFTIAATHSTGAMCSLREKILCYQKKVY